MKHEEHKMQVNMVRWFKLQYPNYVIYAIPNGGKRNLREAIFIKKEGGLAGVADLHLPLPNKEFASLYIEVKTEKGRLTPSQKDFRDKVVAMGNAYVVSRSLDEFIDQINIYTQNK